MLHLPRLCSAVLLILPGLCFVALDASAADVLPAPLADVLEYRCIGPFRGGRSAAVTGVPGKPTTFYFGAAGGGVWKTGDGGSTWQNITDGYFGGSIGAVTVAPSDPNTIYVGGGEVSVRGNVSHGDGIWKSQDGGKTWQHLGLADSHHVPRIRVHPTNPDVVYVAALGHLYGPSQERGVYRSTDGGDSWERVLFVSDEAGACDLIIDPNNPRVLYASTWKIRRTPFSLESGGEGSGLWKSTDAGDTWTEITRSKGLPKQTVGIIGVAVSPVDSERVWALIEANDGGLFRSDDGGTNWIQINDDRELRQRAWYYTRLYAGPKNIDQLYVLNVSMWQSNDGGKSFSSISTPHGDHHDLWIDPDQPERMVVGDDGGAQVTFDGGTNWSTYMNQPTAQFYRVTTDNHFPYRIYGAQQDNSTVRILHRTEGGGIAESDWESTAGGESGHLAPHPENPEVVYGGSYGGYLARLDHSTGQNRNVDVWPDNPIGRAAGDIKYRFQWNFPIFFSPHSSSTIYTAANVLFKSTDDGRSWEPISPDLTRNEPSRLGPSGGPITKDNTGVEVYCTIFAAAESSLEPGVLWTGSDDGLIHVSKDAGANWENVTPPELPEWSQINSLEIHPTKPGGLYIAATRYKSDDFKPYLLKTTDYGKTWSMITDGIPAKHFTRVIRSDPNREGLLYAGTEQGMYVSFDDGESWGPFQLNLPVVPITDLTIKDKDLIVATQGRSFWVLDDLTLLHQWSDSLVREELHVFESRPVYRFGSGRSAGRQSLTTGQNASGGVPIRFWLRDLPIKETQDKPNDEAPIEPQETPEGPVATLEIRTLKGDVVRRYSSDANRDAGELSLELKSGINEIVWDRRYPAAKTFSGLILWAGGTQGPEAIPGSYLAVLTVGGKEASIQFELLPDPRFSIAVEDFEEQLTFLLGIRDKLTKTHEAIETIRDVRSQIQTLLDRLKDQDADKALLELGEKLTSRLSEIEETLYQTKSKSGQDPLNYPIRLNNRLSALVGVVASADGPPTNQAMEVHDMVVALIDQQLESLQKVLSEDLESFNEAVAKASVPAIFVK